MNSEGSSQSPYEKIANKIKGDQKYSALAAHIKEYPTDTERDDLVEKFILFCIKEKLRQKKCDNNKIFKTICDKVAEEHDLQKSAVNHDYYGDIIKYKETNPSQKARFFRNTALTFTAGFVVTCFSACFSLFNYMLGAPLQPNENLELFVTSLVSMITFITARSLAYKKYSVETNIIRAEDDDQVFEFAVKNIALASSIKVKTPDSPVLFTDATPRRNLFKTSFKRMGQLQKGKSSQLCII